MRCGQLLVTWAQGHLTDLTMPEDYKDRDWRKWSLDTLPVDPSAIGSGRSARARCRAAPHRRRAAVAERCGLPSTPATPTAGEAIFRRIADMEELTSRNCACGGEHRAEAIRAAWRVMKPESECQVAWSASRSSGLADRHEREPRVLAALQRTVQRGPMQTPTLAMSPERDRRIRNHKPVPFWTVIADMGGWRLSSERIDSKDAAMLLCGRSNAAASASCP